MWTIVTTIPPLLLRWFHIVTIDPRSKWYYCQDWASCVGWQPSARGERGGPLSASGGRAIAAQTPRTACTPSLILWQTDETSACMCILVLETQYFARTRSVNTSHDHMVTIYCLFQVTYSGTFRYTYYIGASLFTYIGHKSVLLAITDKVEIM